MATHEIEVLDESGAVMDLERGDLLTVADAESQQTLAAELASLRQKAEAGLLPQA